MAGRTEAMHTAHVNAPAGRRYNQEYGHWLKVTGWDRRLEPTTRKRLLTCLENYEKIEKWRATLTANQLLELNHPAVVLRRWQKKTQVKKPDNAEPKLSAVAKLKQSIVALEEENTRIKRESARNAPFTPQNRPKDIANYIWRTIHQTPKLARSVARALDQIAKEAEQNDTTETES
jgi:type II secretory pathway component HofQ